MTISPAAADSQPVVVPAVELAEAPGVGAAGVFALTEASTRRRAVAVGRPTAVSAGAIWASESLPITGIIITYLRGDRALVTG